MRISLCQKYLLGDNVAATNTKTRAFAKIIVNIFESGWLLLYKAISPSRNLAGKVYWLVWEKSCDNLEKSTQVSRATSPQTVGDF